MASRSPGSTREQRSALPHFVAPRSNKIGVALTAVLMHAAPVLQEVSLAELYACVAAAEEEDLLEQHAQEQHEQWLRSLYAPWMDLDSLEPDQEKLEVDVQAETPPTHAQAVGIVQHLLGARLLNEL